MVITKFGGPEVFALWEMPRPEPKYGELLVRVVASGTNPVDAKIRANGTWAGIVPPAILGYDVSGIVEKVGSGVTEFSPGDEVFYTPEIFGNQSGSYAEYNAVSASIVAKKPQSLSHLEAAAVPLAGGTAWETVVRRLKLQSGETILIHGGAGGVGSFAIQIAKSLNARTLATAGSSNQDTLRQLGADVAIDYQKQDPAEVALRETGGEGVDAVFDAVGGENLNKSLTALRPFGRAATTLGVKVDLGNVQSKNLTIYSIFLTRERGRLQELTNPIEQRKLKPFIDQVLPLEEVRKAHERLDSGHGKGKIVLRISEK
jgi:NADPH2:quinone reductase